MFAPDPRRRLGALLEEMMMERGFGRDDYGVKLVSLPNAYSSRAFIVCIGCTPKTCRSSRAFRFFRDERFMERKPARAARPSAVPRVRTYLVYSVGQLMLLSCGRTTSNNRPGVLAPDVSRHPASQGTAPFWLHRQLMLGGADDGDFLR